MPYEIERVYQDVLKNLNDGLLDPAVPLNVNDRKRRANLRILITTLEFLRKEESDNPLFSDAMHGISDLADLLKNLLRIYDNYKNEGLRLRDFDQKILKEINSKIVLIIRLIFAWLENIRQKSEEVAAGNSHLKDLKLHPKNTRFYTKVKEFNPDYTEEMVHPINEHQKAIQRKRTTEELVRLDVKDPITGARNYRKGDDYSYPGSKLIVSQGHHRLYELYRRFLQERLNGNTLVEFIIDEKYLKKR